MATTTEPKKTKAPTEYVVLMQTGSKPDTFMVLGTARAASDTAAIESVEAKQPKAASEDGTADPSAPSQPCVAVPLRSWRVRKPTPKVHWT